MIDKLGPCIDTRHTHHTKPAAKEPAQGSVNWDLWVLGLNNAPEFTRARIEFVVTMASV